MVFFLFARLGFLNLQIHLQNRYHPFWFYLKHHKGYELELCLYLVTYREHKDLCFILLFQLNFIVAIFPLTMNYQLN